MVFAGHQYEQDEDCEAEDFDPAKSHHYIDEDERS